ncbi:OmpA family protein [Sneathiella sp.]|uniref:OmpA family protein n=1 Tax=Sneathiella sp. TaxID=1964365 RepID=UPI0035697469
MTVSMTGPKRRRTIASLVATLLICAGGYTPALADLAGSVTGNSQNLQTSSKIVTPRIKPSLLASKPVPKPPVKFAKLPENTGATGNQNVSPASKAVPVPLPTPAKPTIPLSGLDDIEVSTKGLAENTADRAAEEKGPPSGAVDKEIAVAAARQPTSPISSAKLPNYGKSDSILFNAGETALPDVAGDVIQAIIDKMKGSDGQVLQLFAYGTGNSVSAARRLSLGRALAVRSKLMDMGIENRKIEVRALGEPEGQGPADRVDLVLIAR